MQYEQSRQRQSDGKWAWTTMHDGLIFTSGGCLVIEGDTRSMTDIVRMVPLPESATVSHHAHDTSEEADRCHWEHDRGRLVVREREPRQGNRIDLCEMNDCDEPATRTTRIPGDMFSWDSCEQHAGTVIHDERNPFHSGSQIWHS